MVKSHGWRSFLRFSGTVVAVMVAAPASGLAGAGHPGGHCRAVHGKFSSVAVPPPTCTSPIGVCTSGQLSGTLNGGTYAFSMNTLNAVPEPDAQFVSFFTGTSVVTTRSGRVLTGIDTGAMNLNPPGTDSSGKFATLLSFTGGGTGFLQIRGTLDLMTGNAEGDYRGEICVP